MKSPEQRDARRQELAQRRAGSPLLCSPVPAFRLKKSPRQLPVWRHHSPAAEFLFSLCSLHGRGRGRLGLKPGAAHGIAWLSRFPRPEAPQAPRGPVPAPTRLLPTPGSPCSLGRPPGCGAAFVKPPAWGGQPQRRNVRVEVRFHSLPVRGASSFGWRPSCVLLARASCAGWRPGQRPGPLLLPLPAPRCRGRCPGLGHERPRRAGGTPVLPERVR